MQFVWWAGFQHSSSHSLSCNTTHLEFQQEAIQIVGCPMKGARVHFIARQNDCVQGGGFHMFREEHLIFSHNPPELNQILIWLSLHRWGALAQPRATQHPSSCLFNPIYARARLRWKGGKWWKLSCLFTSDSFHSSARTRASLLMIPTLKWKQQIWLCQALSCGVSLLARQLRFHSWKNRCVL